MSLNKRKQARAIEQLASKLPLTNLAGGFLILYLAANASGFGDGVMKLVYFLAGALIGVVIFGAVQGRLQRYENVWRTKVRELASKMESKIDETSGGKNKLLDAYAIQYLGGHPSWVLKGQPEFGTIEIYDKFIVFKNRQNRIKFSIARIRRVTAEPFKNVRPKKIPNVFIPAPIVVKQPLANRLFQALQRLQRLAMFDYLDDLGQKNLIIFMPVLGNPLAVKSLKESVDMVLKTVPKEKRQALLTDTPLKRQASTAEIEAAVEASRRAELSVDEPSAPPPPPVATSPAEDVRYLVRLEAAGATPDEQAAISVQMASLFNLPPDKVAAAVSRTPFVIKRNLSYDQAKRFTEALTAIGAIAYAEAMDPTPSR